MTVLDASAVLAMLNGEPGGALVRSALDGAQLSVVNLAEVLGTVIDVGDDPVLVRSRLAAAGVRFIPMDEADSEVAAAIRGIDGGRALSLGDRCCLALALRTADAEVLTADRAWVTLDLPLNVEMIR